MSLTPRNSLSQVGRLQRRRANDGVRRPSPGSETTAGIGTESGRPRRSLNEDIEADNLPAADMIDKFATESAANNPLWRCIRARQYRTASRKRTTRKLEKLVKVRGFRKTCLIIPLFAASENALLGLGTATAGVRQQGDGWTVDSSTGARSDYTPACAFPARPPASRLAGPLDADERKNSGEGVTGGGEADVMRLTRPYE
ncbi:hypothetical protein THAOC_34403 [Thalassiosira oceanica]|uniref:Uncharacterized protein n=1 Tax=Thalassiosira oceanica TaxID=159749 RepID=K0R4Z4_THAOC|nr:hypothetical protein THAOC_34403 [Thalassiosira oceanica]|eukprot:EJK46909.1 hypothetical protein THAOC_34403 [Thalassiosira oceanica]